MAQYVEGTRRWLYEIIDKWIEDATSGLQGTTGGGTGLEEDQALRMFMLLAGPVR